MKIFISESQSSQESLILTPALDSVRTRIGELRQLAHTPFTYVNTTNVSNDGTETANSGNATTTTESAEGTDY